MTDPDVRKGMPDVELHKDEFLKRFKDQFFDPAFEHDTDAIAAISEIAWDGYIRYRKNPRKVNAGPGFANPEFELPVEWLTARRRLQEAAERQKRPDLRHRVLLVNGSMRTDQSCPGEMSKSWRLLSLARETIEEQGNFEIEILDLSRLTSEYGRKIHPCKSCVSTAMPLCHWPCSCYPNYAMGQVDDWMAEVYPMWVAAHGIMIVTPVNWYQAPSGLKAMIDRLVCADGGNPDPTTTEGKDPAMAKALELKGWPYPRHLAGRVFSVIVHGDTAGSETLRRILTDWLTDMGLVPAGKHALLDRYVGYFETYAESHKALDSDNAMLEDTRTAALALATAVRLMRQGELAEPDAGLSEARPK